MDEESPCEPLPGDADDTDAPDDHDDADHDVSDHDAPDDLNDSGHDVSDEPARWARVDWYVCLGLLAMSVLLVGMHTSAYETLSPIDELQHVDYMIRAGEFDIPRKNERVEFQAMDEAACRSVDAPGYEGPPCGLPEYDPAWFQEQGFNTSAGQFPPYYVVTGVSARVLTSIGVFDSKVTAARMLGAVWLAAAWAVTWYVMALLDIRRRHRLLVIGLLAVTPLTIFHAGATVNADVSLMLGGALAVLATIKYESGRLRWWWLALAYTALFFVEATSILAIAAGAAYLIVRRALDASRPWSMRLAPLITVPWLYLLRLEIGPWVHRTLFPAADPADTGGRVGNAPMFMNHYTTEVSLEKVLAQVPSTFTPVSNPYFSPPLRSQLTITATQLTNWLLIALLFAAAFVFVSRPAMAWWSRVVMAALLTAGPFYTFYFAYFSSSDFAAPSRFALPLVPLMAVAAAGAIKTRAVEFVTAAVLAVTGANTLYQLVTAL